MKRKAINTKDLQYQIRVRLDITPMSQNDFDRGLVFYSFNKKIFPAMQEVVVTDELMKDDNKVLDYVLGTFSHHFKEYLKKKKFSKLKVVE